MIESTAANFSQVLGLYPDAEDLSADLFQRAMQGEPTMTAIDADGVESRVWAEGDPSIADDLKELLADRPIFIADGHHRYTTALAYRDARREADKAVGAAVDDPSYDYLMMALVNMDDSDLIVLPTHRIADSDGDFDASAFFSAIQKDFDVSCVDNADAHGALDQLDRPAFLIKARGEDELRLAVLRPDVDLDTAIPLEHSSAWKQLDVSVLQELVLNPLLGIHPGPSRIARSTLLAKEPHTAMKLVGQHDVAFILRPTGKDQMRAVSLAGDVRCPRSPPTSTPRCSPASFCEGWTSSVPPRLRRISIPAEDRPLPVGTCRTAGPLDGRSHVR